MTYANLLSTFWIVVSVLLFCLLRKKGVFEKILFRALFVTVILLLWAGSAFLPIENLFRSFDSPEAVFQNMRMQGEIEGVLYGNDSYMLVFTGGHLIARRSEEGYKQTSVFTARRVVQVLGQNGYFNVLHVRNTEDYYIIGGAWSENNEFFINDSSGREIENVVKILEDMGAEYHIWFAMFVENFTDDFYFYINGERIDVAR